MEPVGNSHGNSRELCGQLILISQSCRYLLLGDQNVFALHLLEELGIGQKQCHWQSRRGGRGPGVFRERTVVWKSRRARFEGGAFGGGEAEQWVRQGAVLKDLGFPSL